MDGAGGRIAPPSLEPRPIYLRSRRPERSSSQSEEILFLAARPPCLPTAQPPGPSTAPAIPTFFEASRGPGRGLSRRGTTACSSLLTEQAGRSSFPTAAATVSYGPERSSS